VAIRNDVGSEEFRRDLSDPFMKFGIKQKILLVLIGVLALSTALNVLLASFFTNRQNEEAAFANLRNDLQGWQSDLHAMTQQSRSVALATVGDVSFLNYLGELMTLEFNIDDPARAAERREMSRTLGYRKTVGLNRLQLVLRTGGFSSIAVYTRGRLSHSISAVDAGMSVTREDGRQTWITAKADAEGDLPFQGWPAWDEGPVPPMDGAPRDAPEQPGVSSNRTAAQIAGEKQQNGAQAPLSRARRALCGGETMLRAVSLALAVNIVALGHIGPLLAGLLLGGEFRPGRLSTSQRVGRPLHRSAGPTRAPGRAMPVTASTARGVRARPGVVALGLREPFLDLAGQ